MDLPIKAFWSFIGFRWGCEEKACSGMWVSDGFVCVCWGCCSRHLFVLSLHVWACIYTCTHISSCPSDYTAISDLHGLPEAWGGGTGQQYTVAFAVLLHFIHLNVGWHFVHLIDSICHPGHMRDGAGLSTLIALHGQQISWSACGWAISHINQFNDSLLSYLHCWSTRLRARCIHLTSDSQ